MGAFGSKTETSEPNTIVLNKTVYDSLLQDAKDMRSKNDNLIASNKDLQISILTLNAKIKEMENELSATHISNNEELEALISEKTRELETATVNYGQLKTISDKNKNKLALMSSCNSTLLDYNHLLSLISEIGKETTKLEIGNNFKVTDCNTIMQAMKGQENKIRNAVIVLFRKCEEVKRKYTNITTIDNRIRDGIIDCVNQMVSVVLPENNYDTTFNNHEDANKVKIIKNYNIYTFFLEYVLYIVKLWQSYVTLNMNRVIVLMSAEGFTANNLKNKSNLLRTILLIIVCLASCWYILFKRRFVNYHTITFKVSDDYTYVQDSHEQ